MDFKNVSLSPEKAPFSSKNMLTFCHKRFLVLWQRDPIACMVMCRPTYISGPARNGSIPPITMTDRPGQGYTQYVLHLKSQWKKVENSGGEKLKIIVEKS